MAKNDIRAHRPSAGGVHRLTAYPLAAGQTFEAGEVCSISIDGLLQEATDDPSAVIGISAGSSQGKDASGRLGTVPTGTLVQVYMPTDEQHFITRNFASDGSGTLRTPVLSDVGSQAGFSLNGNGQWVVDTGASNLVVEVVAVLDRNGHNIGDTVSRLADTGEFVVFGFVL